MPPHIPNKVSPLVEAVHRQWPVSVAAVMTVHSVESSFIIHWLETQADLLLDAARNQHGSPEHSTIQAANLYNAAITVCNVWASHEADATRIRDKAINLIPLSWR